MKLRRIMSAMLAAALATSTVAFAEDIATERELDINLTVENSKGTYTFTDEELAALVDYYIEVDGYGEDLIVQNDPMDIFSEDSIFTIGDGKLFNVDQIYRIEFELIDIEKDADGNTSFTQIGRFNNRYYVAKYEAIWGPGFMEWDYEENYKLEASDIISVLTYLGAGPAVEEYVDFDYDAFDYADIDMIDVIFYTEDELGETNSYTGWLLTENGAKALNAETGGTSAPETPEAPASDYEVDVTEALTAEDIADVIAANADSDVVINGENGVSFKFAKGTMAAVDGVEAYDFTSTISTDLSDAVSDKLTEDNFVMSIDYAYSGKLPAKAEITIPVGAEYAGKTLYYSRVLENGVKLIDSAEVDENGYITVTQDSCSDYLLTTKDISADAAGSTDGTDSEDKNSADTGAQGVAAAAGIALAAGAAVLFSRKRK